MNDGSDDHPTPDDVGPTAQKERPDAGKAADRRLTTELALENAPDKLSELTKRSWLNIVQRVAKEFNDDHLTDWAAALTYYAVLSIFPGILVLLASFNLLAPQTRKAVVDNLTSLAPGTIGQPLTDVVNELSKAQHAAGLLAFVGLAGALWSASGYISAFMRASNAIYDVPEGRPIWKSVLVRLAVTVVVGTLVGVAAVAVVLTGGIARQLGDVIGVGGQTVQIFDYAKWPVLVIVLMLVLALLYWASPNARQSGFRWISPGSILAVALWIVVSLGFALYVANFSSYNKTYGTLGGIIAFLVWLWLSNLVVLLGAEFDAELERARAIQGGYPADEEPYLPLRNDKKAKDPKP
jgi:membrane protein